MLPLGRAVDTGNAKRWLLAGFLVNVAVFVGFIFVSNPMFVRTRAVRTEPTPAAID